MYGFSIRAMAFGEQTIGTIRQKNIYFCVKTHFKKLWRR